MEKSMVRRPAVAGRFYPARAEILTREIEEYLGPGGEAAPTVEGALGCIAPHAGYMYSGHVAGAVYRRLPPRASYIVLGPNHFGRGAPLATNSSGTWLTPLGEIPVDHDLATALLAACPLVTEDREAHVAEHSIEVHLPFLQHTVKEFRFVPVAVGVGSYAALESLGHGVARAVESAPKPVMIVASSDMNHYEPDSLTRIKDRKAIDQILKLDARGLYDVVHRENISMCGYGPAVALVTAANDLGAKKAELVKYATSADAGGDADAVVGYAGIIIS